MRKLKIIGSFFTGYYVFGVLILSALPDFIPNQRELSMAFGVLMGLFVAVWYSKNSQ